MERGSLWHWSWMEPIAMMSVCSVLLATVWSSADHSPLRSSHSISVWMPPMTPLPSTRNCLHGTTSRMSAVEAKRNEQKRSLLGIVLVVGWWRRPNHGTPETLRLTEPTPCPMLDISGLLNLLTWVEHRQLAQASQHEEGGVPCPVPHPTRLPPARFQTSHRSVGGSATGQSSAAPLATEPSARTSARAKPRTEQGGRR